MFYEISLNIETIILYSDAPQKRKRRRAEEGRNQGAEEGTSKVPNTEAPARKKRKGAVNRPNRTTKATKPGQSNCQTAAYYEHLILPRSNC